MTSSAVPGIDRVASAQRHSQAPSPPLQSATAPTPDARDASRSFDFLHGQWRVRNRRLRRPLSGTDEWDEFEATSVVRPLLNGRANIEEWEAVMPTGHVRAVSLHLYDAAAREWRLHWATDLKGQFGVPTIGTFAADGRGEFFNVEEYDGRTILLRIVWEDRGPVACWWEQAFSVDGGRSWETNWVMDFARVG